ncbi:MAG: ATP-binding protein [Actinobacteria bacterium]|nr:ATP-binding protein [Actinomycetota bacterium]
MVNLINSLLYLASSEEDALRSNKVSLRKIAMDLVKSHLAPGRMVVLEDGLPVIAAGDSGKIETAVSNLIDNSVKYTREGGKITIRVGKTDCYGTVEVTDDGIGIPPEDLPHVFERFYRSDKARSRSTGGAGIGLSIVKSVVEAHGGRVEAESTPNVRTTFRIYLPLASTAG